VSPRKDHVNPPADCPVETEAQEGTRA